MDTGRLNQTLILGVSEQGGCHRSFTLPGVKCVIIATAVFDDEGIHFLSRPGADTTFTQWCHGYAARAPNEALVTRVTGTKIV
jgi:hypothetical protein